MFNILSEKMYSAQSLISSTYQTYIIQKNPVTNLQYYGKMSYHHHSWDQAIFRQLKDALSQRVSLQRFEELLSYCDWQRIIDPNDIRSQLYDLLGIVRNIMFENLHHLTQLQSQLTEKESQINQLNHKIQSIDMNKDQINSLRMQNKGLKENNIFLQIQLNYHKNKTSTDQNSYVSEEQFKFFRDSLNKAQAQVNQITYTNQSLRAQLKKFEQSLNQHVAKNIRLQKQAGQKNKKIQAFQIKLNNMNFQANSNKNRLSNFQKERYQQQKVINSLKSQITFLKRDLEQKNIQLDRHNLKQSQSQPQHQSNIIRINNLPVNSSGQYGKDLLNIHNQSQASQRRL